MCGLVLLEDCCVVGLLSVCVEKVGTGLSVWYVPVWMFGAAGGRGALIRGVWMCVVCSRVGTCVLFVVFAVTVFIRARSAAAPFSSWPSPTLTSPSHLLSACVCLCFLIPFHVLVLIPFPVQYPVHPV